MVYLFRTVFVLSGVALMIIGLAMGVTLVLLPVGLVVGLSGLGLFVTGQVAWKRAGPQR